ncbi:MAG: membrane protein insertase YidC [Rikenellaceae bacterium]
MNKNTVIGFVLMLAIVMGFSWYSQKQMSEQAAIKMKADSINTAQQALVNPKTDTIVGELPSAETTASPVIIENNIQDSSEYSLSSSFFGEQEYYTLQNDKMIVTLSNKGGAVRSVELKDYKTYSGDPLMLFKEQDSEFNLTFYTNSTYGSVNTSQRYFKIVENSDKAISMRLYADSLSWVEYRYALVQGSYMVDFNISFNNMEHFLDPAQTSLSVLWATVAPQQERGFEYENQYTTIGYKAPNSKEIEELSASTKNEDESVGTKLEWVAFKQQFFSSIIVSDDGFLNGDLAYTTFDPKSGNLKHFIAKLSLPYSPSTTNYDLDFYFGPNDYNTMKSYDRTFQNLIPLGWSFLRWITIGVIIPTFDFFGRWINNYGVIILLLTLVIKLIIFPLTYKSYLSMAKMRLIKPEIDAVGEKYKKDNEAMKKQQAIMELYKRAGVNPMGGCLPMLIQFPIIIAMFRFFPASIELRQEHFLWAKDLSSYDSILKLPFDIPFYGDHVSLFALLMALSMYFTTKQSMANNASMGKQLPGMNAMMLYFMPIMLMVWFNNYSSGLCYYYLLSNLITMFQTYLIRSFINDDKLHQRMKDNAKKPIKKSKFQKRLEELTKQQQAKLNK